MAKFEHGNLISEQLIYKQGLDESGDQSKYRLPLNDVILTGKKIIRLLGDAAENQQRRRMNPSLGGRPKSNLQPFPDLKALRI